MPTSTSTVRKTAPRHVTAKRRESIAAFEQWQRNWSVSLKGAAPRPEADAEPPPKRTVSKHDVRHASSHHSR